MSAIILASGSAIRKQILEQAGIKFDVIVKPVDEGAIKASMLAQAHKPRDIADALAEAKARRVSLANPGFVIGADQIMEMEGRIFDKPVNMDDARQRLVEMRGKTHSLIGAIVVCEDGQAVWRHASRTKLTVRDFSDDFLETYLEQEADHICKSVGAYRFEGPGAQLFSHVEGDFFSILGLSLLPLLDYLRMRGAILT